MFLLSLIVFSVLTKFMNSYLLIKIPHHKRFVFQTIAMVVGFGLTAFVSIVIFPAGFWLALLSAVIHGIYSALGESTTLGWIKNFPSILIGAYASGTGFSGIVGTTILLVFKSFDWFVQEGHEGYIFIFSSICILFYFFAMWWLHK